MKQIQKNEIQKLELEILTSLVKYFDENEISYFTAGGTTLGVVRHKGFIPWDDDIDLLLPRESYDKLMKISDGVVIDDYITIKKPGDKEYIYPYMKACNKNTIIYEPNVQDEKYAIGIFVDIFPLDGHKRTKLGGKLVVYRSKWYKSLMEVVSHQKNLSKKGSFRYIVKEIVRAIQKPIAKRYTVETMTKKIDNIGRKLNNTKANYYGNFVIKGNNNNDFYSKECFESAVTGSFEGLDVNLPVGHHEYLTEMYGDYMVIPPKEKQIMHGFDAWYKD